VGEQLEIGANHRGMMSLARRFVTVCGELSAPRGLRLSDKLPLSDNKQNTALQNRSLNSSVVC
jgi:hypothetical protein